MKKIISALVLLALTGSVIKADNTKYVNVFMGTAGDHGQVTPAAQVPLGLVSVCPDSDPARHGGYDFDVPAISGISVTRVSGVGGNGGGGNLSVRPAARDASLEIVKGSEKAHPGYYEAALDNGVKLKLTASSNVAVEAYSFPKDADKVLFVNFDSAIDHRRNECSYNILDENNIEGWVMSSTVCNRGVYKLYFHLWTSEPFTLSELDKKTSLLSFDRSVRNIEVRIALSPLDKDAAAEEYAAVAGMDFETIHKAACEKWSDIFSRVNVKGGSKEQRQLFYTGMYRVFLSPFKANAPDGSYVGTDGKKYEAEDWTYYSEWSMWDTFRTKFPMFCILAPDEMSDMCRSLVSLFRTGKQNWATMQECVPTVRTEHSQITLLDAWSKGIRGFDMAPAFPGMVKEYEEGLEPGAKQGLTRNAPDQKMETIYDIWALSKIAGIIGDKASEARFKAESESIFEDTWKKDFMTITDDFALMKDNGLYQGTRWQYRWAMPVFADKMIEWVGRDVLADQLGEFFSRHLFNQGNEPDIQTPFMFNLFGRPECTDSLVHALITDDSMVHIYGGNAEYPEPFIGRAFQNKVDGYAPEMDEDDGTMSAWYMFCQMGFYPVCVGTDSYELFTPLFKKVKFDLPGCKLTIARRCKEAEAAGVIVDGQPLDGWSISHSRLFGARKVVFK